MKKGIFVIGYRKAGTTTVFDALVRNRYIGKPGFKEPQFFCQDADIISKNINWYKKNMISGEILLDGSSLLVHYPSSYDQIIKYVADPSFIVCIRNPVKRMFSAYLHMFNKYGSKELRSFTEIIEGLKTGGQDLIEAELNNLELAAKKKRIDVHYFGEDYHKRNYNAPFVNTQAGNLMFYRFYYESLYSKTILPWIERKHTHIIVFESLLFEPEKELKKLFDFLKLDYSEDELKLPVNQNISFKEDNISKYLRSLAMLRKMKTIIPEKIIFQIKTLRKQKAHKLSKNFYYQVLPLFEEEIKFWNKRIPTTEELWKF